MARSSTSRRSAAADKKASNDRRSKNMWFGGLGAAGLAVVVAVIVLSSFSGNSGSAGGNRADGVVENFSFTLFQGQERLGAENWISTRSWVNPSCSTSGPDNARHAEPRCQIYENSTKGPRMTSLF